MSAPEWVALLAKDRPLRVDELDEWFLRQELCFV